MNEVEQLLTQQLKFLRKLKRMKASKLRRLHNSKFIGTKYSVKIPRWMHRSILERRLFYFYCLTHYHYPDDHPVTKEFRKKAKHILSADYLVKSTPEQQTKDQLRETENFTATNIRAMPIVEVDRYLAGLSLFVEANEKTRRKVLYEWFNSPSRDLIRHLNDKGENVAHRRKGKLNNKFKLRDLILENPSLPYNEFMEAFGNEMPTVTRASYNNTRCLLREAGYEIPVIRAGPGNPAVVTGIHGFKTRARMLNDTTTKGIEDG